jgi:RNA polymerase sigma-70 factor, ECF subfamily
MLDPQVDHDRLTRAARGDRAAFEELYRTYHPRVFGYLYRTLGNAENAEEVAIDVMVEVWKQAKTFRGDSKVSTWVFGIARFKALTGLRRKRTDTVDVEEAGPLTDPGDRPDAVLEREGVKGRIRRALARLSEDHREVMELTFFQGFSYPEIAALIDCPVNTVKTRMFHARKQLRELLGAGGVP